MTKNLLILERSSTELEFKQEGGTYVLEGIFGEIDKKNRNNRIYTESEYLPQIEALQAKIKSSKLLGELDHPQTFDVSLKNVSHIIEELTYDTATKQVKGRIRLLDTDAGRQAKALVDAGVPLQISSRAAGAVESNGTVKIKQLFTYDLVADPGFENAELKRVNESYGFVNEGNDLFIYEINNTDEKQTIENINETKMAESKFITVEDFNKYSKYLSEEIKSIKEGMNSLTESESTSSQLETLKEYTDYLAKKLDESIKYSEHIAEKADQGIQYSENLAVKLDQGIQYSEHIAESVDAIKNYTNYLAESYNEGSTSYENLIKYTEYLRENLEKVTEYAEYVAETVNSNLLLEDEAGIPAEDIEDGTKDVSPAVVDADGKTYDAEKVEDKEGDLELKGSGDAAGEEIKEANDGTDAGLPAEDIKDETKDVSPDVIDADGKKYDAEKVEDKEGDLELKGSGDAAGKDVDAMEAYKNSIASKLEAIVEKVNAKKNEGPSFIKFISEEKVNEFNALTSEEKSKVVSAVEGKGYLTEGQILGLWANSLMGAVPANETTLAVISMMPSEYHETWTKLSEAKKNQIIAQSKMHRLETSYQVANFWQTRDLRETAPVMEKIAMVNEAVVEEVKTLGYDVTEIGAEIAKRFKK
jgi:predicted RNA-binding protein with EMAP domain